MVIDDQAVDRTGVMRKGNRMKKDEFHFKYFFIVFRISFSIYLWQFIQFNLSIRNFPFFEIIRWKHKNFLFQTFTQVISLTKYFKKQISKSKLNLSLKTTIIDQQKFINSFSTIYEMNQTMQLKWKKKINHFNCKNLSLTPKLIQSLLCH